MERFHTKYTPDEEAELSKFSIRAAEAGVGEIYAVSKGRLFYLALAIGLQRKFPDDDRAQAIIKKLKRNIDFMGEVESRAEKILQIEGRDFISDFDRAAQQEGLGSVFDKSSEAYKKYESIVMCDCPRCKPE